MNDEQREEFLGRLCDTIVDGMPLNELKVVVWDQIYDEMISQEWVDLLMMGEDYNVEVES
jgi:hypothetical protein